MYLCINEECLNVFDGDYIKSYLMLNGINSNLFCPIRGCIGLLVEIDENIIETILILNKKGYRTLESCSGHLKGLGSSVYILFDDRYVFDTLPNGFSIDYAYYSENDMLIGKSINGDISDRQMEIWNTSKDLLEWAEALPVAVIDNEIKEKEAEKVETYSYMSKRPVF